ncbi:MAG: hypothetical protein DRP25_08055 [Thermotoga sp.]|nr:MAG: hypothetical protein DRP25_08055 [Thermotoga sp.]
MSIEVLQRFGVRKRYITTLKREGFTTVERLDEWLKERNYDHFYLILLGLGAKGSWEVWNGFKKLKKTQTIPAGV